jgi:hypothetical protein
MTSQLIGSALDRVVNSKTFSRSRSLQEFLTFIVTQSLEPDQNLKEYRIGVDALKRGGAFDPAENSIVRVQAYRLRAKLADYYQHEGQSEDVRIDLEPGSYKPVIRECAVVATLRSLRFPGLILDLLPFEPPPAECANSDAVIYLYTVISSHLDFLLRSGLRHRPAVPGHLTPPAHGITSRHTRVHVQLDFRARSGDWGMRLIAYLTNADSHCVVSSHALSKAPGVSIADLEKAGVGIAEAIWRRVDESVSCNG